jgi:glycosyltransferase involved in cell wall biosynthesis
MTVERKRLLFLCQTLPFPPDSGVHLRSYNVLRLLAREFDVTALCFFRRAAHGGAAAVAESVSALREFAEVEAFPIPQEHRRLRLLWDHGRSVVSGRSYTRFAYESGEFAMRLHELLGTKRFDLVHVDSLDLCEYLPSLKGIPVVVTHHNVESDLLRRRSGTERSPALRRYLSLQAKLTERDERRWCPNVALNVSVSPIDRQAFDRLAPNAPFTILPNGVDTRVFQPGEGAEEGIVFVGGYSWFPNRDSMDYFATEILPLIPADNPIPVTWVGRAPEFVQESFRRRGVAMTGYVEDIRPHVQRAACYVVPLRVGGGTRLKILDAWAMGKAVVSTSVGCEGLDARDGENILIRDDARSFAEAVGRVLCDVELRQRLASGARETAERSYDWDVIGARMVREYSALLQN